MITFGRIAKQALKWIQRSTRFLRLLPRSLVTGFLRSLYKLQVRKPERRRRSTRRVFYSSPGFILPTAVITIVVLSLLVGALLIRSSKRTQEVALERASQVVENAATPAIERAKAKFEFLFERDYRTQTLALPDEDVYYSALANDGHRVPRYAVDIDGDGSTGDSDPTDDDPYTLPGETRIDLNGAVDGSVNNAWTYAFDTDGDGVGDIDVAYSISLLNTVDVDSASAEDIDGDSTVAANLIGANDIDIGNKTFGSTTADDAQHYARYYATRTGPIERGIRESNDCPTANIPTADGWIQQTGAVRVKNVQVNAVARERSGAISTLELVQDRLVNAANALGAWFRYDLELHPGPDFRWNGSMFTGGSYIMGNDSVELFLNSAPNSCFFGPSNLFLSEQTDPNDGTILFQGQYVSGILESDRIDDPTQDESLVHTLDNTAAEGHTIIRATSNNDSVISGLGSPEAIALDPIELYLTSRSVAKGADSSNASVRDAANWDNAASPALNDRIVNQNVQTPLVDDTYRADNRWGPKPVYDENEGISLEAARVVQPGLTVGDPINLFTDELLTNDPLPQETENVGLDGYWERRAYIEGLRAIVGQRLELGNASGWTSDDPLHPPTADYCDNATPGNTDPLESDRCNEKHQLRTLRDNLSAVQSAVFYHSADKANLVRDFPIACLASTAHAGTQNTITRSTDFTAFDFQDNSGTTQSLITDFFGGRGTNGWEFEPPGGVANNTDFGLLMDNGNNPLRIALRNLANFAGDPAGAYPPQQDDASTTGAVTHPFPFLTMWGDFSNLRRVMNALDAGTAYADLSIADQSTLHTASCTLGMLAYNVERLQQFDYGNNTTAIRNLADALLVLDDGNSSNGEVEISASQVIVRDDSGAVLAQVPTEDLAGNPTVAPTSAYLVGLREAGFGNLVRLAETIHYKEQVERDRQFGFANSPNLTIDFGLNPTVVPADAARIAILQNSLGGQVSSTQRQPSFPSLFYLFPVNEHGHNGLSDDGTSVDQTTVGEEYIDDTYIFDETNDAGVNFDDDDTNGSDDGDLYQLLVDTNGNGTEDSGENGIAAIALTPRPTIDDWLLPRDPTPDPNRINRITDPNGTERSIGFMDKVIMNGREMMAVRVMDFDLNLIRNRRVGAMPSDDHWLPRGFQEVDPSGSINGIIYAFREDAVREDGIARPRSEPFANCDEYGELVPTTAPLTNSCGMDVVNNTDPPVSNITGISPKPVDYYPDPDRRPHGFRLRSTALGGDIRRQPNQATQPSGITSISDNPVFIQGDFNVHDQQEFTQNLNPNNWNNFYTRTTLNPNFARPADPPDVPVGDRWRPAEVLSDAVTILSNNFCDGSIEEGIIEDTSTPANCNSGRSSFLNTILNNNGTVRDWLRENPFDENSPIQITRNAEIELIDDGSNPVFDNFQGIGANRPLNNANETDVGLLMVSGLVPSRPNQAYGGLHNFPRFNENWNDDNLNFLGAFIQLNFSTYATAPYDQDAFEAGSIPQSGGTLRYYRAPNRRWGYDVALQANPPGPVAARFLAFPSPRTEIYQELPAADPYILQLRCADRDLDTAGVQQFDPSATCS